MKKTPLELTNNEIENLIGKPLKFHIGKIDSDDIVYVFEGEIVSYTPPENFNILQPFFLRIKEKGRFDTKTIAISRIKKIEMID